MEDQTSYFIQYEASEPKYMSQEEAQAKLEGLAFVGNQTAAIGSRENGILIRLSDQPIRDEIIRKVRKAGLCAIGRIEAVRALCCLIDARADMLTPSSCPVEVHWEPKDGDPYVSFSGIVGIFPQIINGIGRSLRIQFVVESLEGDCSSKNFYSVDDAITQAACDVERRRIQKVIENEKSLVPAGI